MEATKNLHKQLNRIQNIDISNYCWSIELQRSMFLIDVLEELYEFNINGNDIEIYKKVGYIKESISRIDFVYVIQVEMFKQVQEYCKTHREKIQYFNGTARKERFYYHHLPDIPVMKKFYEYFGQINILNKSIDNIIYLKKNI